MKLQDMEARKYFTLFGRHSKPGILAGWIFEAIVLRILNNTSPTSEPLPQLFPMHVAANIRRFTTGSEEQSSVTIPILPRKVVYTDFKTGSLTDSDLSSTLIIPQASNCSLFDAAIIEFGQELKVTIWVFQVTIASEHGGSPEEYGRIREIARLVQDKIGNEKSVKAEKDDMQEGRSPKKQRVSQVEIRYILVCPAALGTTHTWQMPEGWDEQNDIWGPVFLQLVA